MKYLLIFADYDFNGLEPEASKLFNSHGDLLDFADSCYSNIGYKWVWDDHSYNYYPDYEILEVPNNTTCFSSLYDTMGDISTLGIIPHPGKKSAEEYAQYMINRGYQHCNIKFDGLTTTYL